MRQAYLPRPLRPSCAGSFGTSRHHHERWDGRGYPDGLKSDEIPIWAQATSLADVYDALTSKRVYKDAYTHEEAIKTIANGECGVFNPKMIEPFESVADELDRTATRINTDAEHSKTMHQKSEKIIYLPDGKVDLVEPKQAAGEEPGT